MVDGHDEAVKTAFTTQAPAFEDRRFNRTFATDVEWIFERLDLGNDHLALDVAGGTGHAARFLSPLVRAVVVLDATAAMLETGREAAVERGCSNVVFIRGDAAAMPFLESSFDVVVCRFAVHHFEEANEQLTEMVRCLRPGGQLVLADLVADADPAVAAAQDRLERLRDPSHTRLLSPAELRRGLETLGVVVSGTDMREVDRPLAPWLAQTGAADEVAAEISGALRSEIDGGPSTGFAAHDEGGELWFIQRFASVTARKPS